MSQKLEVIRNALPAIANEMAADLQRTSYNMMIYEVRDFCTALLDAEGQLVSQNVGGVSHFVADLGVIIQDAIKRFGKDGFSPDDVIITNHQAVAGQHLNNVVVYMPYFFEGELIAFPMVRAHWIDVGGMSTGFGAGARATDPWMEGLQMDQLKIYEAGRLNKSLHKMLSDNIRFPEASLGDMRSQIAACHLAIRRLDELFGKYGRDTILVGLERIFSETEEKCRNVVEQIPDGVYEASALYDNDGVELDETLPIHAKVTVAGSDMTIDLSGCAGERKAGTNGRTFAGGRVAYKSLIAPHEPVNEGSFRALDVIIPEGNIMMARYPRPMTGWGTILPTVVDTILTALSPAIPDRIPAAHHANLGGQIFFGTHPETGKSFVVQTIEGGGWGGAPGRGWGIGFGHRLPGRCAKRGDRGDRAEKPGGRRAARLEPGFGRRRKIQGRSGHPAARAQSGGRTMEPAKSQAHQVSALGFVGRQAGCGGGIYTQIARRKRIQGGSRDHARRARRHGNHHQDLWRRRMGRSQGTGS